MTPHIYTIDVYPVISRFRAYHNAYANPQVPEPLQTEYVHMVVEQMIAHFENEHVAVMSFMAHYTVLITDPNVSPLFKYHPLKFLRQMDTEGYQHYTYCLYGFAEEMFKLLLAHRLYNENGILCASFEHITDDVLYLAVRPEVSSVFLS